jgi:death-on-curing protein
VEPLFLTRSEVLAIHEDQVRRYGGSLGLRDAGLLESALAQPSAGFGDQYFHSDVFDMAAAYLYHLVMNHPFVDGNKRVGTVAARVFLRLNGGDVPMREATIYELVVAVAEGRADKAAVADAFRAHSVQLGGDE